MTLAPKRAGTAWLRVADVAELLGVSVNTVRRWTDAGRIAAHRSPGGHRRYRATDVEALARGAGGETCCRSPASSQAGDRQTEDVRAVVRAGLDLVALLSEAPWDVPEEVARRLCDLTDAPRCDILVREGRRLRLAVSVEGGELDTAPHRRHLEPAGLDPVRRPAGGAARPRRCRRRPAPARPAAGSHCSAAAAARSCGRR